MKQQKGPKTFKGMIRKMETGDGRKKTTFEKMTSGEIKLFHWDDTKKKQKKR